MRWAVLPVACGFADARAALGVCCARELVARLRPGDRLTLVAPGDVLKVRALSGLCGAGCFAERERPAQCVENVERVTRRAEVFDGVA